MAYLIKTEQELKQDGLWNYSTNTGVGFPTDGSKDHLMGITLNKKVFNKCKSGKPFTYEKVKLTPKHIKQMEQRYRFVTEDELNSIKKCKIVNGILIPNKKDHSLVSDGFLHKLLGAELPYEQNRLLNKGANTITIFDDLTFDSSYFTVVDQPITRYKTIRELVVDGATFCTEDGKIHYKGHTLIPLDYMRIEGRRPFMEGAKLDLEYSSNGLLYDLLTTDSYLNELNDVIKDGDFVKCFITKEIFRGHFVKFNYFVNSNPNKSFDGRSLFEIIPLTAQEKEKVKKELQDKVNQISIPTDGKMIALVNFVRYSTNSECLYFNKDVVYPYQNISETHIRLFNEHSYIDLAANSISAFQKYVEFETIFDIKF